MENYSSDGEHDETGEQLLDAGAVSDEEEGFMKGYTEDEEVEECAECEAAIEPEKKVVRTIQGEKYKFCSKECADEFEEGVSED
jgi:hypothetical protein